jgi:hydroxyquinol 1,2-dioxygenase
MVDLGSLTGVVERSFDGLEDSRRRQLLKELVRTIHDFVVRNNISHAEWRQSIEFLHRVGDISNASRSEFSLLSDVLGISSLVDLIGAPPGATPSSVLGPFHSADSPWRDNPVDLVKQNTGEVVILEGVVKTLSGSPIADATIDFWQNADNGLYWQVDPSQPADNLRCKLKVGKDGHFLIRTIRPKPYCIPTDGPVWKELVEPARRSAWRPGHFHVIVSAPGYQTIVTEIFGHDDPYLATDAVFGVREGLLGRYEAVDGEAPRMRFDFELARGAEES